MTRDARRDGLTVPRASSPAKRRAGPAAGEQDCVSHCMRCRLIESITSSGAPTFALHPQERVWGSRPRNRATCSQANNILDRAPVREPHMWKRHPDWHWEDSGGFRLMIGLGLAANDGRSGYGYPSSVPPFHDYGAAICRQAAPPRAVSRRLRRCVTELGRQALRQWRGPAAAKPDASRLRRPTARRSRSYELSRAGPPQPCTMPTASRRDRSHRRRRYSSPAAVGMTRLRRSPAM